MQASNRLLIEEGESSVAKTGLENANDTSDTRDAFSSFNTTLPSFLSLSSNNLPFLVFERTIVGAGIYFLRLCIWMWKLEFFYPFYTVVRKSFSMKHLSSMVNSVRINKQNTDLKSIFIYSISRYSAISGRY
jgi:hypothetical protein